MKKSRIIILLLLIALTFTSCITKEDIKEKEDIKQALEDEFDVLQDEYDKLEDEFDSMTLELAEKNNQSNELVTSTEDSLAELEELKDMIPNPPFPFLVHEFVDNITEAIDGSKSGNSFKRSLENDEPDDEKLDDELNEFVYELKGDVDSDKYITLTFVAGYNYDDIYDITVEYSSSVYEDDYNDLVQIVLTALVMTTEDPYNYDREYYDAAKDILEDGDYFNEYMIIEQETEGETGKTRIFCRNY